MATHENNEQGSEATAAHPEAAKDVPQAPLSEEELGNVNGGVIAVRTTTTTGPLTTTGPTTFDPTQPYPL